MTSILDFSKKDSFDTCLLFIAAGKSFVLESIYNTVLQITKHTSNAHIYVVSVRTHCYWGHIFLFLPT